ncbi:MAG: hypothetical protein WCE91_02720 [Nitrososphaeraceae archaeon]
MGIIAVVIGIIIGSSLDNVAAYLENTKKAAKGKTQESGSPHRKRYNEFLPSREWVWNGKNTAVRF